MAVTIVVRKSAAKAAKDGKPAKPAFEYKKIITPATKRGGKEEASKSEYPKFVELVELLKGKVEFVLDKDGQPTEACACSYLIDGINLDWNQSASFAASNTVEQGRAKVAEYIATMAAKFNMTVEEFKETM